ncbi:MAG: DUF1707 and DUF2154 domain-containing protein [Gemmatimonadota bacterium]|nr:DUF1707 and DUF2154 domain-containing protein [Gemmatimonadota bacterium]MDE3172524.1 DUF1707 and DUF2154 domain-containing protein [Gemmatimonadota bacterium]
MPSPEQPGSVQALERERERVVTLLSRHFANDRLNIDELEARLELAYRAQSMAEVRALVSDLADADEPASPGALRPAPPPSQSVRRRMLSILSAHVRRGVWIPPQELDLVAVMSDTHLDLREAQLTAGVTEIRVRAWWAALRITVPAGVHVVTELQPVLASLNDRTGDGPPPPHGAPVIRISGWAVMSDVAVRRLGG